jgi:hypothetical protein
MKVQLARLFGSGSMIAKEETRTDAQWRRTLLAVLHEIDSYLTSNIRTDEVHLLMLHSGLYAAHESLKQDDFWPGYAEGITRLALVLMGDYPDHRKRRGGRKEEDHYALSQRRSIHYDQKWVQKLHTLLAAPRVGIEFKTHPEDALREFRARFGYSASYEKFFKWYRQNHPADYAAIF